MLFNTTVVLTSALLQDDTAQQKSILLAMNIHGKHSHLSPLPPFHSATLGLSDKTKEILIAIHVTFFQKISLDLNFLNNQQEKWCYPQIMDVINLFQILSSQYAVFFLRSSKTSKIFIVIVILNLP